MAAADSSIDGYRDRCTEAATAIKAIATATTAEVVRRIV
jgi:hypothetical protein